MTSVDNRKAQDALPGVGGEGNEQGLGLAGKLESSLAKKGKGLGSDELGTGYEEDTEKGSLSSESSDASDKGFFAPQSETLFKPVEPKSASDMTLEELRASKLNQNTDPEDVKAPGLLVRAKEEAEAIGEQLVEGLNLKQKRSASENSKEPSNQGGLFNRIAETMGFASPERSQSQ